MTATNTNPYLSAATAYLESQFGDSSTSANIKAWRDANEPELRLTPLVVAIRMARNPDRYARAIRRCEAGESGVIAAYREALAGGTDADIEAEVESEAGDVSEFAVPSWILRDAVREPAFLEGGEETVYIYGIEGFEGRIKIGKAAGDPYRRIAAQQGTATPGAIRVFALIKCDDAAMLEAMLHKVMRRAGRQIDNAPGREWFRGDVEAVLRAVVALGDAFNHVRL